MNAEAARATLAARVARRLEWWKGHMLMPATRKADRQKTYDAIFVDVMQAALGPECYLDPTTLNSILREHGITEVTR